MHKIESISAGQWAQCHEMRQSIYDLCSSPTDQGLATKAVNALYSNAGRTGPKIVFCKSPLEGLLLLAVLKTSANLRANLKDNLREALWSNLGANLRANLKDNLREALWSNLGANLWDNLRENLWANLRADLRANLRENLWANLREALWENLREALRENLGFFYYERACLGYLKGGEIAGVKYNSEKWEAYKLIVESLDIILPFEDLCIVCERPTKIGWHDAGGIHCEDGPAVEYADGYCLWAIEGYQVPKPVVMEPHLQTIEEINNEQNEEIKRIRINRFGWSRFISESGANVLDVATPKYGGMESLMACSSADQDFSVLCTYDPSTGRPYALEVDPDCKTCEEAQRYLLAPEVAFGRHGVDVAKIETYPLIRA